MPESKQQIKEKPIGNQAPLQQMPPEKTPKKRINSGPIAGNIETSPRAERMRSLPAEEISESGYTFFIDTFKDFEPLVPETGAWARPIRLLRSNKAQEAHRLISSFAQNDTTAYLLSVAEIMLKRPTAAETLLYPLLAQKEWKTEAQYLLIWVYLLEDKLDLARASMKVLPNNYRDKGKIEVFLGN